jgi:ribulose-phosphate 3-epimerase
MSSASPALETVRALRRQAPLITAGVLSADVMNLGAAVESVRAAGVKMLHFDVMDGRYCPLLTFGAGFVKGVKTDLLKDVHLMIEDPIPLLGDYVAAGADMVVVNLDTTRHIHRALQALGGMANANDPSRGLLRGVALNPGTPLEAAGPLMEELEVVFLLAVNPGWGGQALVPATRDRLRRLAAMVRESGREILLGLDGGVTAENIGEIAGLGAELIVAGSAVFKGGDAGANARKLMAEARRGAGART